MVVVVLMMVLMILLVVLMTVIIHFRRDAGSDGQSDNAMMAPGSKARSSAQYCGPYSCTHLHVLPI